MKFQEEEIAMAKQTDLCAVASAMGFTIRRIGRYHTIKEMDSIRIYNRSHWYRWSNGKGGSQIDFVMTFGNMDFKEAVSWLLDFVGHKREAPDKELFHMVARQQPKEKKPFELPEYAGSNQKIYHYLMEERGIAKEVIDYFVKQGTLYESKPYHNVVFVGRDASGTPKFASMRGIYDRNGKAFKCDVEGNDKHYGFARVNMQSKEVTVFEGAIDLLSYMTMFPEREENLLALGMVSDAPLETFLSDYPHVQSVGFALDNDEPGRKATQKLISSYLEKGYVVTDISPEDQYKDYNEMLLDTAMKKSVMR